jgi:hypothetical protein
VCNVNGSAFHTAGALIVAGIVAAITWRLAVAPTVLGDFDPADMPHGDRAFLSIGVVMTGAAFAAAQHLLARRLPGLRLLRAGAWLGAAAALCAAIGAPGLTLSGAAGTLLSAYVVLMGAAWALVGFALFRAVGGGIGRAALVTGTVYALAAVAVFAGAFIIFVMSIGALPLGIALLFARGRPASGAENGTTMDHGTLTT